MTFPTLYKKTSTGAIQQWEIRVAPLINQSGAHIVTTYGQVGTDSPQETFDFVSEGKNAGKKNETSPVEQAYAEAKSKYEKQLKSGYVTSLEAAEAGELDVLIEGGVLPMLAHTFEKQGHKIKYPAFIQKKYDGTRMICIVKNGKCTLWSRTRKPIHSLPHIVAEIEKNFKSDITLDGEAYSHKFKDNFEHIIHLVRQDEPDAQCTDVEYHVYDVVNDRPFKERIDSLQEYMAKGDRTFQYLKLADTFIVENEEEMANLYETFRDEGYEGCMVRNSCGLYVNKRSYDLQKVKEMQDDEFDIVGIEEGRGKLQGHVGAFVCSMNSGKEFSAKMSGDTSRLKEYFDNHSLWANKRLTVKFQGLTGAKGVPRFPVGIRIRSPE
jgi:DNA ligase 1